MLFARYEECDRVPSFELGVVEKLLTLIAMEAGGKWEAYAKEHGLFLLKRRERLIDLTSD